MLRGLFSPKPEKRTAQALHRKVVEAARQPALYGEDGVPDTIDGRFELIVLHTALVVLVLQSGEDPRGKAVSQALFDAMFDDFDAAMRELGVGDSAVGKKIRFMAEGFYGRAKALGEALEAQDDSAALIDVLSRNTLAQESPDARAERLALYVNSAFASLQAQGADALIAGADPDFPSA
ncbi:ubiquinol-cytochrome C chaperone family protein [Maricaulis parjimensis]|uniref:ubiquinol-cytochrome C chaperone family protein n=1 Tax=Maricaulis parjimensis TaxID=144023 RepID=UPI00193A4AB5|nr:ubiquinol-cytochrome C chaperone family protein [Maricaulis parjimensis]